MTLLARRKSAKKTRQWAPNPYAIAQLLVDNLNIEPVYESSGEEADKFLHRAFNIKGERATLTEAVELFRKLAVAVGSPMSTAQVLELAEAKRVAQLFAVEQIKRILPYLVPLLDAEFKPFDTGHSRQGQSVQTWFGDAGQLMIDEASYLDPIQGAVSNCYLISAMIALAWVKPPSWEAGLRSARFSPPEESSFEWRFHNDRGRERSPVKISGRIPVNAKRKPRYARSASGESWPSMLEKAYVMKMRGADAKEAEPTLADYQAIEKQGSTPPVACQVLAGGLLGGEILDSASDAKLFSPGRTGPVKTSGVVRRPVMAWTKDDIGVKDRKVWEKTGLWPNHAYAVLGVMPSKHIVLRNPHGVATTARRGYATGKWQPDDRDPVELNKNGVFAISPPLFFKHFEDMGWVEHKPQRRRRSGS
ncbi:MAG TPA: C2 family cysteine protease [Candidatus Binatia bacterium]|nr:C2 family cysteine protease [Candidatus Binatia bacterium]